jgi:hypothetical protein
VFEYFLQPKSNKQIEPETFGSDVRRNAERFPEDFMFQLGKQEFPAVISQIATSNSARDGRRKLRELWYGD